MRARRRIRQRQRGYALLFCSFLAALMIIATWAVVPDIITQARREKEEELIWRGEQYARAVRLYYRKNGRFPQSLEDLSKPRNQIRFLRQEYKDPFNNKDGKWRLLYIGPNGQIIGSVKNSALSALTLTGGGAPRLSDRPGSEQRPQQNPPPPAPPAKTGSGSGTLDGGAGTVFGGNIIGVGSTIDRKSLKGYRDGITYREWEFFWDPTGDRGGGQVVPGVPGRTPGGQQPPGQRPRP